MELFGFTIKRKGQQQEEKPTVVAPINDDGSIVVSENGVYGSYLNLAGDLKSDKDYIRRYRETSLLPEVDIAIDDIINESIVMDESEEPVGINLDKVDLSEQIKDKIKDEWNFILKLLDFKNNGYEVFKKYYVDGRIYHHMVIDQKKPQKGITKIQYIDPLKIKKIKKVIKEKNENGVEVVKGTLEFYIYNENGFDASGVEGVQLMPDSVSYVTSGLIEDKTGNVISHLHKTLKTANMLKMGEDSSLIYRISRAPERRIFYIDVGSLPKNRAEAYLKEVMNKYKNKMVFNAETGELASETNHMTMTEDYWLPRREGGKGTEIDTLAAGQNLGEMEDILYYQKKLYKSLNVPVSRLEQENGFNLGRATEISRDEMKFGKFVSRLRKRFSEVFDNLLKTQLILKKIITPEEWEEIRNDIYYTFVKDSFFVESKKTEILAGRISLLRDIDDYVGKYFSIEYVQKEILMMDDDERKSMNEQIKLEKANGETHDDEEERRW